MTVQNNSTTDENSNVSGAQGVGQVYVLYAVSLLLVLTAGLLFQFASIYIGLAITELALILLPAVVYLHLKRVPVAEALRWRVISPAMGVGSVILGVSGWGVAVGCHWLLSPVLGKEPNFGHMTPTNSLELLWLFLSGALLPGICEESLFRGAIQGTLERLGPPRAILYSALLFAFFHLNPWNLVPAFLLGMVFGILVLRTGSTIPAILAHISSNATAFTVSYAFRDQPESAIYPLVGVLVVVFAVAFPYFWLRTGRDSTIPALLSTVPSGLSRQAKWATVCVCAVLMLLLPATAFAFVGAYTVSTDHLLPDLERGDRVVVLKGQLLALTIDPGDIVAFRRDGRTYLRKVTRVDNSDVWISDESSERKISRLDITAKVIHRIRLRN